MIHYNCERDKRRRQLLKTFIFANNPALLALRYLKQAVAEAPVSKRY